MDGTRIDKWLWAARFFKTRSLAQRAIESGHVLVGGERVKLARTLRVGEHVQLRIGTIAREVAVRGLSERRESAPIAQQLYEETEASVRARVAETARRALYEEPAQAIEGGRPTKRQRRDLERLRTRD
jgi:ribosome-associated heat shock protein Hsp15